ncbi:thermonuclease family protein [Candidatus Phycosocius spiralis]|nr:thermonuclease family protein [Candidatus Phycosocius spiralis]
MSKRLRFVGLVCGAVLVLAATPALERGESGQVIKIIDGDSFILDGGLEVRLAQIEAPRVRPGDTWGARASADLEKLLLGKKVELRYSGLRRDRRGRAIAHVFIPQGFGKEAIWVQPMVLKAGLARVHTYADNRAYIGELWQAERAARREGRGLWGSRAYQVRYATPEALQGGLNSFQLMEGKVASASQRGKVMFLNFGTDAKTDVTAVIPQSAFQRWPGGVQELTALQGRSIRVRGYVRNSNGPSVWLDHPEQIEFIMAAPSQAKPNDMKQAGRSLSR